MERRDQSLLGLSSSGFHRIRYYEWGAAAAPVLICVHGLTRTGRDFDDLARTLGDRFRLLCPDIVGRGRSDWLDNPVDYSYPQYCADMTALIARSGAETVDWVGTSMGGLIGLALAAQPNSPIRRLVLNDVGPWIPRTALERIAGYVGELPRFDDIAAMEAHIRQIAAPFGPLTDAQWRHLTEHAARSLPEGGVTYAYDPRIDLGLKVAAQADVDLWAMWDRIRCPVLVLRGAESDLLLADVAEAMTRRGPRAKVVCFNGVGHAPALMDPAQIRVIDDWLTRS